jgi:AcrR family transcriptional regulator
VSVRQLADFPLGKARRVVYGPGHMTATQALSPQAEAIRDAARELLETEGPEGLSMRRLSVKLGVHPPALYRHFQDKRSVEDAIIEQCYWELGDVIARQLEDSSGQDLAAVTGAYRAWGLANPHLYRLVFGRPQSPDVDPAAVEHLRRPLLTVAGRDEPFPRAIWAACHGHVSLELDQRFPPDTDIEAVWTTLIEALSGKVPPGC